MDREAGEPPEIDAVPPHRVPVRIVGTPPAVEAAPQPADSALRALPVAGINRRRAAWIVGVVASVWIVAVFARQVGDASAAAARADQIRNQNAALSAEVAALQHERDTVQERSFVEFQAREFGLGDTHDQRFQLSPDAPSLSPDAPGSASALLGPEPTPQSPLDSWLALLFGPGR
jgi:hypothetical protein